MTIAQTNQGNVPVVLGLANGPGTGAEKYGPIIFVRRQLLWDYNE